MVLVLVLVLAHSLKMQSIVPKVAWWEERDVTGPSASSLGEAEKGAMLAECFFLLTQSVTPALEPSHIHSGFSPF